MNKELLVLFAVFMFSHVKPGFALGLIRLFGCDWWVVEKIYYEQNMFSTEEFYREMRLHVISYIHSFFSFFLRKYSFFFKALYMCIYIYIYNGLKIIDLNSVLELFNPNVFFISTKNTYLLGSLISRYFLVFLMETSRLKSFSNHYQVTKKKALVLK